MARCSGSHKFGRATLPHETFTLGDDNGFQTFPLIGKAGSLALWNGAVWHASLPRHKPGLRVTLVQNYFRTYMRPQAMYDRQLPAGFLEANPELASSAPNPSLPLPPLFLLLLQSFFLLTRGLGVCSGERAGQRRAIVPLRADAGRDLHARRAAHRPLYEDRHRPLRLA